MNKTSINQPYRNPTDPSMTFHANVISGEGRGRRLNAPTLNLDVKEPPVEPGVYAVRVVWDFVNPHEAVMHVGPRPTFEDDRLAVEVHLLDVTLPSAPSRVHVQIVAPIRDVRSFDSGEALKKQIQQDIMAARALFAESGRQ